MATQEFQLESHQQKYSLQEIKHLEELIKVKIFTKEELNLQAYELAGSSSHRRTFAALSIVSVVIHSVIHGKLPIDAVHLPGNWQKVSGNIATHLATLGYNIDKQLELAKQDLAKRELVKKSRKTRSEALLTMHSFYKTNQASLPANIAANRELIVSRIMQGTPVAEAFAI